MRLACLLCLTPLLLAQGRGDRWERLSRRDSDGDGRISRAEFPGADRVFDRMDADGDGFVTKDEVAAMGGGRRGPRDADRMKQFDTDGDGKVGAAEWKALFDKADENKDGELDQGELNAALAGRRYNDPAPKVGDPAPKVSAKEAGPRGRTVDLSQTTRPTVLVFGSWT